MSSALAGPMALLTAAVLALSEQSHAQIPGLPVLQSPFATPQIAAAVNASHGDALNVAGVAGAWTPQSARLQVSGAVARIGRDEQDAGYAGGARVYVPVRSFAGEAVTLGVFVGAGAERRDSTTAFTAPVGASVGYRRALGATRAFAVYAVPFYSYTGVRTSDASTFLLRYALGADVVIVPRVGLTVGFEGGAEAGPSESGLRSRVTGVGLSYAF